MTHAQEKRAASVHSRDVPEQGRGLTRVREGDNSKQASKEDTRRSRAGVARRHARGLERMTHINGGRSECGQHKRRADKKHGRPSEEERDPTRSSIATAGA